MSEDKTLNLSGKLQQESVIQFIRQVDWTGTSDAPLVVELDPTSMCNLACPDCISGELLNQEEISTDRLLRLVDEMIEVGVRAVILIGGGEPMMHPAIGEVISRLGQAGIQIGITTNGLFLKKHLEVTAKYASWVRVSMDAGSSETFNRIRPSKVGKSLFDVAIRNMAEFAKLKVGKLGYSYMVYNEGNYGFKGIPLVDGALDHVKHITNNAGEIAMSAQLARDIGCYYFEVKPMYEINHYSVMQSDAIVRVVDQELIKAKRLETEAFKVLEASKLWATLHGESNLEPKSYSRCAVAQMRTLITPSGVYVCPYFRGAKHKMLGRIQDMSFKALWHGQQRLAILNKLNPSRDCPMHCIRNDSNLAIENWVSTELPESVPDFDLFV